MAKLQPSKLIMRVRFPLPAFPLPAIRMKKTVYIAAALLAGACIVPAHAAGPELDRAVALSAPDSKALLSDICNAVYKAVKEAPQEPDKVFEAVLNQRTTWKASECYAIMRAILLARPDLAGDLSQFVLANKGGKDGKGGIEAAHGNLNPVLYNMLTILYQASLEDGVPEDAINTLMTTITGVYEESTDDAENPIGDNTNTDEFIEIIPTPPPTSVAR